MPPATQIKRGQVVILDNELYRIIKLTHVTPGKGNAVVQTDLRNINTGVKIDKRFRSAENVDVAHIDTRKMQFLYADGNVYHFMDTTSYEQFELNKDQVEECLHFLIPEQEYTVDLHDGHAIGVELPSSMVLEVIKTDPPQKGLPGKYKAAELNTGLTVKVPLFVGEGDKVKINTDDESYLERA